MAGLIAKGLIFCIAVVACPTSCSIVVVCLTYNRTISELLFTSKPVSSIVMFIFLSVFNLLFYHNNVCYFLFSNDSVLSYFNG
uniref:Uncharacterized protein n=1 Tax=Octopus bimaculoides TaxID=37653 RepID=A0A0L8FU44_OCTBM